MAIARASGLDVKAALDGATPRLRRAVGCTACRHTGFAGRTTIYELLTITRGVRDAILASSTERVIENAGIVDGMTTLLQSGLIKALRGETTSEEVLRVTRFEECQDTLTAPTIKTAC